MRGFRWRGMPGGVGCVGAGWPRVLLPRCREASPDPLSSPRSESRGLCRGGAALGLRATLPGTPRGAGRTTAPGMPRSSWLPARAAAREPRPWERGRGGDGGGRLGRGLRAAVSGGRRGAAAERGAAAARAGGRRPGPGGAEPVAGHVRRPGPAAARRRALPRAGAGRLHAGRRRCALPPAGRARCRPGEGAARGARSRGRAAASGRSRGVPQPVASLPREREPGRVPGGSTAGGEVGASGVSGRRRPPGCGSPAARCEARPVVADASRTRRASGLRLCCSRRGGARWRDTTSSLSQVPSFCCTDFALTPP